MWVKGRRGFAKGRGLGNGLGKPEEMEGQREKTTYEWGRGGCNSWTEKVNAIAGGDEGLHRGRGRRPWPGPPGTGARCLHPSGAAC